MPRGPICHIFSVGVLSGIESQGDSDKIVEEAKGQDVNDVQHTGSDDEPGG